MARQMQTAVGATSNLKDAMTLLAVEVGNQGLRDAWTTMVAGAAEVTNQLREQLELARETAEAERRTLDLRSRNPSKRVTGRHRPGQRA